MITFDPAKCSGCVRCEVNCAFFHSGRIGRSRARIKVVKLEEQGIDFAVVCQHCQERYCTKCPQDAIQIDALGQVIVSPTLCTVCGTCETLCPIGAIELYNDIAYVCDLCGGDPRCVKACTMGALSFEKALSQTVSLKQFKKGSRGLTPEQKRVRYALACVKAPGDKSNAERQA